MRDSSQDDDIAVEVRCLPTIGEPEGWGRAPILDGWCWQWSYEHDLVIVGHIHGHGVAGDGKPWTTDYVTGIDSNGRFVEDSEKAVYRLGWPRFGQDSRECFWPPVLYAAAHNHLECAAGSAKRLTGGHTLPVEMLSFLDAASAKDASPADRRKAADRVAEALFGQNRNAVASAWMLSGCDVLDSVARRSIAQCIDWAVRDVEKDHERKCTTAETRARNGWNALANMEDAQMERLLELAQLDRDDPVVVAHSLAQLAEVLPPKSGRKSLSASILDDDEPTFVPADGKADSPTAIVMREVGLPTTERGREAQRVFAPISGQRLSLVQVNDLNGAGRALRAEFPYAAEEIDVVLSDLIGAKYCKLRPTVFVGEPGGGKSRLAWRLAETLGLHVTHYDAGGVSDSSFSGTARRWSTGEPSVPVRALITAQSPTVCVLIDEIEKAGTGTQNGQFAHALLGFCEPSTARRYHDPYADCPVDCSYITYLATANDPAQIPYMLRDRFRFVRIPPPRREDLPAIARTVVADLARESGSDPRWYPPLDESEIDLADHLWRGNRSLRRLRAIVSRILVHRANGPRH